MLWDLTTNCSGLELWTFTIVREFVGLKSSAKTEVETPRGDFKLLMTTGGFGLQVKSKSNKTYPTSGFIKQIEPFSSPISKGKYSNKNLLSCPGFMRKVGSPINPAPLIITWNEASSL